MPAMILWHEHFTSSTVGKVQSLIIKHTYIFQLQNDVINDSVSTRAVIGQFWGPYFTVRPANFENFFFRAPD